MRRVADGCVLELQHAPVPPRTRLLQQAAHGIAAALPPGRLPQPPVRPPLGHSQQRTATPSRAAAAGAGAQPAAGNRGGQPRVRVMPQLQQEQQGQARCRVP